MGTDTQDDLGSQTEYRNLEIERVGSQEVELHTVGIEREDSEAGEYNLPHLEKVLAPSNEYMTSLDLALPGGQLCSTSNEVTHKGTEDQKAALEEELSLSSQYRSEDESLLSSCHSCSSQFSYSP